MVHVVELVNHSATTRGKMQVVEINAKFFDVVMTNSIVYIVMQTP